MTPDKIGSRSGRWVDTQDFGRCRLLGNAHTFPGRIAAWSETHGHVTISKSDVVKAGPAATSWIDGFLMGNEPSLATFLGLGEEAAGELSDDDPAVERWQNALATFRATGELPTPLSARPVLAPPDVGGRLWSLAGGEVLGWNGSGWVADEHQPALHFAFLAGSRCDARGAHQLEAAGPTHLFCRDCLYLEETDSSRACARRE